MRTISQISDGVLRDLIEVPGPVTSVYFTLEASPEGVEDAELRWRALTRRLAAQSAGIGTIRALTRQVTESLPGTGTLAAFAVDGELLFVTEMPGSRQGDLAVYQPLPHLLPLLEWRQEHPAHVLAVVDRTGADLEAYPLGSTEAIRQTVVGPDDEIEPHAPRGLSQGRYQNRAEDSWEHNAARVADALGRTVSRISARLVLLAGDVRAVQYLTKHLPATVRRQVAVRTVRGGRSRDGSAEERAAQVEAETHRTARLDTQALLRRLTEERRPGGRTVEGVRATLDALSRGRASTLVIVYDPRDTRTAWFGPDPHDVSDRRRSLGRAGVAMTPAPLADVAVRAAVFTGASVRVLPPGTKDAPAHGIGALCRYA